MTRPTTSAEIQSLRKAYGEAATAYYVALDERQAVTNDAERQAWFDRVGALGEAMARAQAELLVATRAAAPPWEVLLRDPTQQFDPAGEVMRSILDYQNATKGTAE